MSKFQARWICS